MWPWSTLKNLKARVAWLEQENCSDDILRFNMRKQFLADRAAMQDQIDAAVREVITTRNAYRDILYRVHFRDPKTGRILDKGVIPEGVRLP